MLNLEKITKSYYDVSNVIQCGVYSAALIYGEYIEGLARQGLRNYDWMQGHIVDIASGAGSMSLALYIFSKLDKKEKLILGSMTPIIFSIEEAALHNSDWQDMICYFGGAILAWTIPHAKEIITDTKKYLESKLSREYYSYNNKNITNHISKNK